MMRVTGGRRVLESMNRQVKAIEGRTLEGLIRGAMLIMQSVEKTSPTIPVEWGNLRASRFLVTSKGGATVMGSGQLGVFTHSGPGARTKTAQMKAQHKALTTEYTQIAKQQKEPYVTLGWSAHYATYTHENVGANFQRPGAGAKWLVAAVFRERHNILRTVRENAKIPKGVSKK